MRLLASVIGIVDGYVDISPLHDRQHKNVLFSTSSEGGGPAESREVIRFTLRPTCPALRTLFRICTEPPRVTSTASVPVPTPRKRLFSMDRFQTGCGSALT